MIYMWLKYMAFLKQNIIRSLELRFDKVNVRESSLQAWP